MSDNVNRNREGASDLDPQEIPETARCPDCGAKPTDESVRGHHLAALGYTHDDISLACQECGREWMLGVPIGSHDEDEDLWCSACDRRGRVHFVHPSKVGPRLMCLIKCPECYHAWRIWRDVRGGRALIGHSDVTGDTSKSVEQWHSFADEEGFFEPDDVRQFWAMGEEDKAQQLARELRNWSNT